MATLQLKAEVEISVITYAVAAFAKCEQPWARIPSPYMRQRFYIGFSRTTGITPVEIDRVISKFIISIFKN